MTTSNSKIIPLRPPSRPRSQSDQPPPSEGEFVTYQIEETARRMGANYSASYLLLSRGFDDMARYVSLRALQHLYSPLEITTPKAETIEQTYPPDLVYANGVALPTVLTEAIKHKPQYAITLTHFLPHERLEFQIRKDFIRSSRIPDNELEDNATHSIIFFSVALPSSPSSHAILI